MSSLKICQREFRAKRQCKCIYYFLKLLAKKYFLVDPKILQKLFFVASNSFERSNTKFQF